MQSPGKWWRAPRRLHTYRTHRRAITLFELMLVLILLVVIGSLSAPLFEGSFSSVRLRRGTDQVLAIWSQARTHAIESGEIYQFRFKPDGAEYRVERWEGCIEADAVELGRTALTADQTKAELEFANWEHEASLPEQTTFESAEKISDASVDRATVMRLDQEGLSPWSAPILFFPDGTTTAATLLIKSESGMYRRATLRALTGVGYGSKLLGRDEIIRLKSR